MATLGVQGDRPLNAAGPIDGHLPARDSGNSGGDALHELAAIQGVYSHSIFLTPRLLPTRPDAILCFHQQRGFPAAFSGGSYGIA